MAWSDEKEDRFQAMMVWLKQCGLEYSAVHTDYATQTDYVILDGDEISAIEEKYPDHFEGATLTVNGSNLETGERIYHVMLPDKYQQNDR